MIARAAHKYLYINPQYRIGGKYVLNDPKILHYHLRDHAGLFKGISHYVTGCNGILGIATRQDRTGSALVEKIKWDRFTPSC